MRTAGVLCFAAALCLILMPFLFNSKEVPLSEELLNLLLATPSILGWVTMGIGWFFAYPSPNEELARKMHEEAIIDLARMRGEFSKIEPAVAATPA